MNSTREEWKAIPHEWINTQLGQFRSGEIRRPNNSTVGNFDDYDDAVLAASAPELLEILKAAYHHFSPLLSHGSEFDRAILVKMYLIIIKAEGKK